MEYRDGDCAGADRSGITFPYFEYCHPDYYSDVDDEQEFTAGVDICGSRTLTGLAVIGTWAGRVAVVAVIFIVVGGGGAGAGRGGIVARRC